MAQKEKIETETETRKTQVVTKGHLERIETPEKLETQRKMQHPDKLDSETVDNLVTDLLTAVARYEEVANSPFRTAFVDGFQNLSRANFSANFSGRRFGMDLFDMRPHLASATVTTEKDGKTNETFVIVSTEKKKQNQKLEQEQEKQDAQKQGPCVDKPTLRNRKTNKILDSDVSILTEGVACLSLKPYDPMAQFGALVPVQLRNAQSDFCSGLALAVELANLQRHISALTHKINEASTFRR